jgi:hypothetical protein
LFLSSPSFLPSLPSPLLSLFFSSEKYTGFLDVRDLVEFVVFEYDQKHKVLMSPKASEQDKRATNSFLTDLISVGAKMVNSTTHTFLVLSCLVVVLLEVSHCLSLFLCLSLSLHLHRPETPLPALVRSLFFVSLSFLSLLLISSLLLCSLFFPLLLQISASAILSNLSNPVPL